MRKTWNISTLDAQCGGMLPALESWMEITSPGYPHPGYSVDQKCSWILRAPEGKRVELEFVDRFQFFCTTTCLDFVEIKASADVKNTGFRFVGEIVNVTLLDICHSYSQVLLLRKTYGSHCFRTDRHGGHFSIDRFSRCRFQGPISIQLRRRLPWVFLSGSCNYCFSASNKPTTVLPIGLETVEPTSPQPEESTTMPDDQWAPWGDWSACSRSCGGCGIQSRARVCPTPDACESVLLKVQL